MRDTYICMHMYSSCMCNNTYITAMYIFTYETPTYSTSFPPAPLALVAFLRHSIFLASFLIWQTKSTLALCVFVYCVPPLYTICYFYELQIHTRTHPHTLAHTRIKAQSYIPSWRRPSPCRTCVFNLCALIIHNSINANKLTLSKMLYRFSFLFFPFFCVGKQPCKHMSFSYGEGERMRDWGRGWTHQLHCRGINLSDFYVNSIHFIYSTICIGEGKGKGTVLGEYVLASSSIGIAHVLATFIRSLCAQIFGKLICNFSETERETETETEAEPKTPSLLVEDSLSANILRRSQIMCK